MVILLLKDGPQIERSEEIVLSKEYIRALQC